MNNATLSWSLFVAIAYLLVGLFVSMVQDTDISDDGKRLLNAWGTTIFWPKVLVGKRPLLR